MNHKAKTTRLVLCRAGAVIRVFTNSCKKQKSDIENDSKVLQKSGVE